MIEGTPLSVHRSGDSWMIDLDINEIFRGAGDETLTWVERNQLRGATFKTRAEAVRAAQAALAVEPLGGVSAQKLIRMTAGHHITDDGRWLVLREGSGWAVYDTHQERPGDRSRAVVESLYEAATLIASPRFCAPPAAAGSSARASPR